MSTTKYLVPLADGQAYKSVLTVDVSRGAQDAGDIPSLNEQGVLDPSLLNATATSTGAADAGKVLALNEDGVVDRSVISAATLQAALSGGVLSGLRDPVAPQDAATKAYVDAVAQGLTPKASVRLIARVNVPAGPCTQIDGVTFGDNDRILLTAQTDPSRNGVYRAIAGTADGWERAEDYNTSALVRTGAYTYVTDGATSANTGWVLATANPITLGTTALRFTQFSGSAELQAGAGLTKQDGALNVGAHVDGSIVTHADDIQVGVLATDAQHGQRGGGSQHALASAQQHGFLAKEDYVKLGSVAVSATHTPFTTSTPLPLGTPAVGTQASGAALGDHAHAHGTQDGGDLHALASATAAGFMSPEDKARLASLGVLSNALPSALGASSSGISVDLARADHVHSHGTHNDGALHAPAVPGGAAGFLTGEGAAKLAGIVEGATNTPLSDAVPEGLGTADSGTSTGAARADHIHSHGSLTGGSLHSTATTTQAGFISAADQTKLNSVATNAAALSNTAPPAVRVQAVSAGASTLGARADHMHTVVTDSPVAIGTQNLQGTASSLARSDHTHDHGAQTLGTLHAPAVAGGSSGFLTGLDKAKLDAIASGATSTPLTATPPSALASGSGGAGTSIEAARADHQHAHGTLPSSSELHHAIAVPGGNPGFLSGPDKAKLDSLQVFGLASTSPAGLGTAAAGSAAAAARADHVHPHGAQGGDSQHTLAVAGGAAGFLSGPDKAKLDSVASGATAVAFSNSAASSLGTAGAGAANSASRADHVHEHGTLPSSPSLHHALAVPGGNPGFLSGADKSKLDSVASGATNTALSSSTPSILGTAGAGSATTAARADHSHAHGDQGGGTLHALATQAAAGFLSVADKVKLDSVETGAQTVSAARVLAAIAGATGDISVNTQKFVNVGNPTSPQDAATKAYVDAVAQGLNVKRAARAIAVTNVPSLTGARTIDGVALGPTDRVLLAGQTNEAQNGLWVVAAAGWSRATDANTSDKVTSGLFVFVTEGDTYADSGWVLSTDGAITLGVTPLTFAQFSGAGQINAGSGLTKTGNQLNVLGHADGSVVVNADDIQIGVLATDAQHGNRGGGNLHANAVASGASGFMSGQDKAKLDAVSSGATNTPLTSTAPTPLGSSAVGTAISAARADHVHAHGDQGGGSQHAAATTTIAGFLSPADKSKLDGIQAGATALGLTTGTPNAVGVTSAAGTGTTAARVDHVHAHGMQPSSATLLHALAIAGGNAGFLSGADKGKLDSVAASATNTPLTVSAPEALGSASAAGVSTSAARADHVHVHGDQAGGTLHAAAVAGGASGFLTGGDKTKLDSVEPGATNTPLTTSTPTMVGASGAVGTSATVARADHAHAHGVHADGALHALATSAVAGFLSAADKVKLDGIAAGASNVPLSNIAPASLGTAAAGNSTAAARANHVHAHGDQTGGTLHAEANPTTAGFLSAADKAKIDTVEPGAQAVTAARVVTGLAGAASDISVNARKITSLADPTGPQDAATKSYVDATTQGLDIKLSVRVVATSNVPNLSGLQTIDGVALQAGSNPDRVLLTAQTNAAMNGIWVVSSGAWTRASDADLTGKVTAGLFTFVTEGDSFADSGWVLITNDPITLGTTPLAFSRFSGAGQIVAGNGLIKSGNTIAAAGHSDGSIITNADDIQVGVLATDNQHGSRGGGSLHATANASVAGFMSSVDFTKLSGVATGATRTPYSSQAPSAVGSAASVGTTETGAARGDHVHPHGTHVDGTLHAAAVPGGASGFITGSDQTKLNSLAFGATNTPLASTVPAAIGTPAAGTGTTAARADHVHPHGNQGGGSQHTTATPTLAGFISAPDKAKLDSVSTGADVTLAALSNATAPIIIGNQRLGGLLDPVDMHDAVTKIYVDQRIGQGGGGGTSNTEAGNGLIKVGDTLHVAPNPDNSIVVNADNIQVGVISNEQHGQRVGGTQHAVATPSVAGFMSAADKARLDTIETGADVTPLTTIAPSAVGNAAAVGTSETVARADHVHAHGTQSNPTHHALATPAAHGFLAATDKAKLDTVESGAQQVTSERVLAGLAEAADHISINARRLTDVAGPTTSTDAATKGYVDTAVDSAALTFAAPLSENDGVVSVTSATSSTSGAMTAAQVTALEGLEAQAITTAGDGLSKTGNTLSVTPSDASMNVDSSGVSVNTGVIATRGYADTSVTFARVSSVLASATADVSLNSHKLTDLGLPSTSADAANKAYVDLIYANATAHSDAIAQGLDVKPSVRCAATTNITQDGLSTVDGVALRQNDRVLCVAQIDARQNGIWLVNEDGAWQRGTDANSSANVRSGLFTFVTEGTNYQDSGWILTTDGPITLGTTSLAFTRFSGAGQIVAGNGLVKSGNIIEVTAADGSIVVGADAIGVGVLQTDTQHGDRGGGSQHAVATQSAAGFLSISDKVKLDSVQSSADVTATALPAALLGLANPVTLASQRLTSLGTPTAVSDATTKGYVDDAITAAASAASVTAGAGLTKTGQTLDVAAHADGSILVHTDDIQVGVLATDTQHGQRGGGTQHALAVAAGAAGFLSGNDKSKIDAIEAGATNTPLASAAPLPVGAANAAGAGTTVSRADHVHAHGDQAGGTLHADATPSTSGFFSASDKTKLDTVAPSATNTPLTSSAPSPVGLLADVGVASTAARADHTHPHGAQTDGGLHAMATSTTAGFLSPADKSRLDGMASGATNTPLTSAAATVVGTASAAGVATSAARADHSHAHGAQTDGTLHATATTAIAGFLSSSDKTRLDAIESNATNTPYATIVPSSIGTSNVGTTASGAARGDHAHAHGSQAGGGLHALADGTSAGFLSSADFSKLAGVAVGATNTPVSSAAPSTLGTASAGTSSTASRADHVHAHGSQTDGSLHAVATSTTAGFLSATDKTKLDGIQSGATNNPLALSSTAPVAVGTTAVGEATTAARADHAHAHGNQPSTSALQHALAISGGNPGFLSGSDKAKIDAVEAGATNTPLASTAPEAVSTSPALGVSTTVARADHVHAHGAQTDGTLHALADNTTAGFLAPGDFTKLADIADGADVTLTALSTASTAVYVNNQRVTGVADPINPQDAATKAYVDAAVQGLDVKASVRVATTGPVNLAGGAPDTVDGVPLAQHNRILVKDQPTAAQNGLYTVATLGSGSDGTWVRSGDANTSAKVTSGLFTFVSEGAFNADTGWTLISDDTIALDTTPLTFTQFSGAGEFGAGAGLTTSGSMINIGAHLDGSIIVNADDIQVGTLASDTQHGLRGTGTEGAPLHGIATAANPGFMSSDDFSKLAGIAAGAVTIGSVSPSIILDTASSAGSAFTAARADHVHAVSLGAPTTIGTANQQGAATSLARSDHVHAHGEQAGGTLHSLATQSSSGFLSATDKAKLDGVEAGATANTLALTNQSPAPLGSATVGAAESAARADHVHAHGNVPSSAALLHALAVAGGNAGFLSGTDKSKLDNIASGATNTPLSWDTPQEIGIAASGSATSVSRSDHVHAHGAQPLGDGTQHAVATTAFAGFLSADDKAKLDSVSPGATAVGLSSSTPSSIGSAAPGSGSSAARSDHVHAHGNQASSAALLHALAVPGGNPGFVSGADKAKLDSVAANATSTPLATITPAALGTGAVGVETTAARADHVHDHGSQGGGTQHTVATTSSAGFLSVSDKVKLDGIQSGATANDLTLGSGTPTAVGTADPGSATTASRSDHAHAHGNQASTAALLHALAVSGGNPGFLSGNDKSKIDGIEAGATNTPFASTTPAAIGTATVGVGTTVARADHVHAHGTQAGGTLHAAANGTTAGFMSASDFTKLSGIASGADVTLTALAAASTTVTINNQRIAGLLDPSNPQDAATKAYVDAVYQGLDVKPSVRVATTGNVANLATGAPSSVDGVALLQDDRVLVKDQATGAQNGIYRVTTVGTGSNGVWERATDANTSAKVTAGLFTFVAQGTANADSGWVLVTDDVITLGSTALTFTQFSGAGQITAGAGLTKTGNVLNAGANGDGSIIVNADDIQVGVLATDSQHGLRGTGSTASPLHGAATASVPGFMSAADFTKLAGVAANATNTPLSSSTPPIVGTGSAGVSTSASRADHTHSLPAFGTTSGTIAQGDDSRFTNDRTASGLRTATTTVAISSATAPTTGQVLTATSNSAATWQTPATGVSSARQIIAGTGLSGGGDLTADRTLSVSFGTTSTTAAVGNDSRLTDDRTASGIRSATTIVSTASATAPSASQVLTATGPAAASWQALPASVAPTRQVIAGTGLSGGGDLTADRTLSVLYGTTATTAAAGNDARLSNDRTASGIRSSTTIVSTSSATAPTANQVLTATSDTAASWQALPASVAPTRQVIAGTGLSGGGDLSVDRTLSVTFGTSATTAAAGNDARLSDDRTTSGIRSATTIVSTAAATAPTALQVLTATGPSAATWQTLPASVATNDARLSDDRTASGLRSATTVVSTASATAPTNNQVLMATGAAAATWQSLPASVSPTRAITAGTGLTGGGDLTADRTLAVSFGTTASTVTAGNDTRLSDDRTASGLRSATTIVSTAAATAPSVNQILTATANNAATWQTPPASVAPTRAITAGTGLTGGGDLTADRSLSVSFGTSGTTVAAGNDARFTDDRTASGIRSATTIVSTASAAAPSTNQVLMATGASAATWQTLPASVAATRAINAGTGLTGGGDLTADRTLAVSFGTSGTTAAVGNDARFTDDRTASGIRTATTIVSTASAAAPSTNQVLTATASNAASWQPLPASVAPTRAITAGTGLSGGGDLTADRTLSVAFGTTGTTATVGNDVRLSDDRTASGLRSATTVVSTASATAPSTNQVLTATGASAATWQSLPASVAPTRQVIAGTGLTGGGDLTADRTLSVAYGTSGTTAAVGNDVRLSDDRTASGLRSASGIVSTAAATAPSANQVLMATSGTVATWQALPAGVVPTRQIIAGTGLTGGGDLTADRTLTVAYGTTGTTACVGNDARLSDARTPSGSAGGQLSGTYPSPSVIAVTSPSGALSIGTIADGQAVMRVGSSLVGADYGDVQGPASSVIGNLPAWGDTGGELLTDSGVGVASLVTTSDTRLLSPIDQRDKRYRSTLPIAAATATASGVAYFTYIGRTNAAITVNFIRWYLTAAAVGTVTYEVGLASSPAIPNGAGQTMTLLTTTNQAAGSVLTTTGMKQNTTSLAYAVAAGTCLWVFGRFAATTTQPSMLGVTLDHSNGAVLQTSAAGAMTLPGSRSGALVAATNTMQSIDFHIILA